MQTMYKENFNICLIRIPKEKNPKQWHKTISTNYKIRQLPETQDLLKECTMYLRKLTQMTTPRHILVKLQNFKDKGNFFFGAQ